MARAVTVVRQEILNTSGLPEFILSDNGTHFSASHVNDFASKEGFGWKFVAAYNLRGNSRMEQTDGTIKTALKKMCAENNLYWDTKLPAVLRGYRQRPNPESTSPFECMFGVQPRVRW